MDKNNVNKEKNAERKGCICGKKRIRNERKITPKSEAMEEKRERRERACGKIWKKIERKFGINR